MMKNIFLCLVIAFLTILSSCCGCRGAKSSNPYNLNSNTWQLIEMNGKKINAENEAYTIIFDKTENKVFGMGDCNRYFANYTETGTRNLNFSKSGSTKMFCPNQAQEDEYLKTIFNTNSYTVDGDVLLLLKDGEVVLIYEPTKE